MKPNLHLTLVAFILSVNLCGAQCPDIYNYGAMGSTSVMPFVFSGVGAYSPNNIICGNTAYGDEAILKFTPPSTAKYEVTIYRDLTPPFVTPNEINFMARPTNGTCDLAGYQCQSATFSQNVDNYITGPLTANIIHDFLIEGRDSTGFGNVQVTIQCAKPTGLVVTDSTSNSITIAFNCNCPNTTYLEYGAPGFTPGTAGTAGGGTLISGVTSPYTISGLSINTAYVFYLRTSCGGAYSFSTGVVARTLVDCANAPVLDCGNTFNYQNSGYPGHWMNYGCGPTDNNSIEKVYRFTPTASGTHNIVLYQYTGGIQQTSLYYKPLSGNCVSSGWTCIGTVNSVPPQNFSFGPLTAGVTYLIMLDGDFWGNNTNNVFQIQCPNVCSPPVPIGVSPVTSTSAKFIGFCPNCTNFIIEYGPAGFTPGTGTSPGAGGTVVSGSSMPFEVYGLTPGTNYSVYSRQNCGAPGGISSNAGPVNFTTSASACNVTPSLIITDLGIYSTCLGSSITLNQYGGLPGTGGTMKWYTGSCGGTLIGTGNSITVAPTSNTTYFVRAESPCGTSTCAQRTITVTPAIQATITPASPTSFCAGGSVLLQANTGPGYTYQWKKYGNVIAGATASSYTAASSGTYKVVVTNNMGCSLSSSAVTVTVNALPPSSITAGGPVTFCPGSSVTLSANTGAGLSYQWRKYSNDIAGATSPTYIATTASQYSVRVTDVNGCTKNSNKITVSLLSAPTSTITANGPITFCAGGSVMLSANSGTGLSYQWKKGSNNIIGATNSQYTATVAGSYKCTVTNSNGCTKNSNVITVSVPCRTATSDNLTALRVYPNPSRGTITVEINDPEIISVVLYDAAGKPVRKIPVEKNQSTLFIENLSKGVYRIMTEGGKDASVLKVVVI